MSSKAITPAEKYLERRKRQKVSQEKKARRIGPKAGMQFVSSGDRGSAAGFLVWREKKEGPPKPPPTPSETKQLALDIINESPRAVSETKSMISKAMDEIAAEEDQRALDTIAKLADGAPD